MYRRIVLTFVIIVAVAASLYFWGTNIVLGIADVWDKVLPGNNVTNENQNNETNNLFLVAPRLDALPSYTNSETITIKGWAQTGSEVKIVLNNEKDFVTVTDASGRFEYLDLTLSEGNNSVYAVTLLDDAESRPSDTQTIVLDTIKPSLTATVTEPTESGEVTVTGQSENESDVFINNFRVILLNDGSFSDTVQLKEGENTIEIRSEDQAGNQEKIVKTITYTPPSEENTDGETNVGEN